VEVNGVGRCTSLLCYSVLYDRKKFYSIGLGQSVVTVLIEFVFRAGPVK
jgi:hypothetical protein